MRALGACGVAGAGSYGASIALQFGLAGHESMWAYVGFQLGPPLTWAEIVHRTGLLVFGALLVPFSVGLLHRVTPRSPETLIAPSLLMAAGFALIASVTMSYTSRVPPAGVAGLAQAVTTLGLVVAPLGSWIGERSDRRWERLSTMSLATGVILVVLFALGVIAGHANNQSAAVFSLASSGAFLAWLAASSLMQVLPSRRPPFAIEPGDGVPRLNSGSL